jgi:hypothetical protein
VIAVRRLLLRASHAAAATQTTRNLGDEAATISLLRMKDKARRLLPINGTARNLILAQKDVLPSSKALARFEIFDRLISSELGA